MRCASQHRIRYSAGAKLLSLGFGPPQESRRQPTWLHIKKVLPIDVTKSNLEHYEASHFGCLDYWLVPSLLLIV